MSKKSRALQKARSGGPIPRTKVKSPADIVSVIPYLLGFDPVESVVVIGLEGPRRRFGPCFRLDLVEADEDVDAQVGYIESLVEQLSLRSVLIVAFSSSADRADPVVRGVCAMLRLRHVEIHEGLRADGERWWSYTCDNPDCCTPEGTPYDVSTSRVAAEAVVAGMQRLPSRDELRRQFDPSAARQAAVSAALETLAEQPPSKAKVDELIGKGLRTPTALDDTDLALLVSWLQDLRRRDAVWTSMTRATAGAHFALWSQVMRCSPDYLMPPAGSLTAFAAWLKGTGVLASHATDRVLAVEPTYSMAKLLQAILDSAINPKDWDHHICAGANGAGGWECAAGSPDLAG